MNLNELSKRVHAGNVKWWTDLETGERIERNRYELLALVISELAEALEGERKDLWDEHLPHRKSAEVEMADAFIRLMDYAGGFGIDLTGAQSTFDLSYDDFPIKPSKGEFIYHMMANVVTIGTPGKPIFQIVNSISATINTIRDYCYSFDYDLIGAIEEKLAYNAIRHDHTIEARKAEGGKKF